MKRIFRVMALLVLFCLAGAIFTAASCSAQEKQTIKIGALLTLTGEWREIGDGVHKALVIGLDQVNHYLAPSGLRFELDARNTAGDPQKALSELMALANSGVHIVIGPMSSAEAKTVNSYANEHGILLLSPTATSPLLSKRDNFFRTIPTDWNQADGLLRIMTADKFKRFVVVYRNDTYGLGFFDQLQQAAASYGIEMAGGIVLPQTPNDYAAAIEALEQKLGPDRLEESAAIFIGSPEEASGVIRNIPADSLLAHVKWFSSAEIANSQDFLTDQTVAAFAANARWEGLRIGYRGISLDVLPYIDYTLAGAAGQSPEALTAWDALWLIAETCRKNPTADIESFKSELKATANQFRNSFGLINVMDENGDTRSARYLRYQIELDSSTGRYGWQSKGHYVNPVISAPFIRTIEPRIQKQVGSVQIGVLLSLSGDSAETSREVLAVLGEAVASFNQYAASVGSDLNIKLLVEDTGHNSQTALFAVNKLLRQGVKTIVGPMDSAGAAVVAPLLNNAGVLAISPASTAPSLSKKDHLYRLIMNDTHQAQALTALLKQDQIDHVLVLCRNDAYGQGLTTAFREAFAGEVQSVSYEPGTKNFSGILKQAEQLAARSDKDHMAILAVSYGEIISLLHIPEGSPLNGVRWYGTDGTALSGLLLQDRAAAQAAARLQFTALGYSAYGNYFDALYPVMNYRLDKKISHPLQEFSLSAFDALWILGCAYLENGDADQAAIEDYVQKAAFRGLSGLVSLDENGDRRLGYYRVYRLTEHMGAYRWTIVGLYSLDYAKKGILEMTR